MIAIDTQILVHAHKLSTPWHERARDKIAELAQSGTKWAIPMHCLVEFYAKATHPSMFKLPSTTKQAIAQIDAWLESPTVAILADDAQTWTTLSQLLAAQIAGNHAYDARIAAVCLRYGVTELWTDDRDFLKFPALRVRNPLIDIHPTRTRESRVAYQPKQKPRAKPSARRADRS